MTSLFKPPLAVHIIWHPSDNYICEPIRRAVLKYLSRDIDRPFSRNLNIPVFLYSSNTPNSVPKTFPQEVATRNVVFVFTSVHTTGYTEWDEYIGSIPTSDSLRVVPLALTHEGLGHGDKGSLKNLNYIRVYEWPITFVAQYAILFMAHEIYRYGFVEIGIDDKGKSSSISIFLSHTKGGDTGRIFAESIKQFIDNTNMSHFFDATEISPGFKFDEEIINHIKKSTLIAITSDVYSSRYWCQREIICAKENNRPMISVNCLKEYEDRIFPAASNVPCVHVGPEIPFTESDIVRVLSAAILETIRYCHALKSLDYYQKMNWINDECKLCARPPEIHQLLAFIAEGDIKDVCYPEPPIYSEESDLHQQLGINTFTPLWSKYESKSLKNTRIGVSISDVPTSGFQENHIPEGQLIRLAQDFARHLLARSGTLIYGGDLRKDGFTEFILEEAIALQNRLNTDDIHVENYLAWPIYKEKPEMIAWRSSYKSVMKTVETMIPTDVASEINAGIFLPPSTALNKYYWSRCLTAMRTNSIDSSQVRICAGGKLSGYNGIMPGVLEEILISIEQKKPIYLLGAFGGVVGEVCKVLRNELYPDTLTETWQITHNEGYVDLLRIAKERGMRIDYQSIKTILMNINFSELCTNSGLDEDSYLRMMASPFIDESLHLVLHGIKKRGT